MHNAITPQELEDANDAAADDGMVINCKMYAQRNSRNLRVCGCVRYITTLIRSRQNNNNLTHRDTLGSALKNE